MEVAHETMKYFVTQHFKIHAMPDCDFTCVVLFSCRFKSFVRGPSGATLVSGHDLRIVGSGTFIAAVVYIVDDLYLQDRDVSLQFRQGFLGKSTARYH